MKVLRSVAIVLAAALVLMSCSSMAQGAMSGALGAVTGGAAPGVASSGAAVAGANTTVADFQSGEIVASADSGQEMDAAFYVAKVLQPASSATKNQAQVVFVHDGSKSWVNFVVNSRKVTKGDLVVGATVFYLTGLVRT